MSGKLAIEPLALQVVLDKISRERASQDEMMKRMVHEDNIGKTGDLMGRLRNDSIERERVRWEVLLDLGLGPSVVEIDDDSLTARMAGHAVAKALNEEGGLDVVDVADAYRAERARQARLNKTEAGAG